MVSGLARGKALLATLLERIVEQLTQSIPELGESENVDDHYDYRWFGSHRHHSGHATGLANGAAGPVRADE